MIIYLSLIFFIVSSRVTFDYSQIQNLKKNAELQQKNNSTILSQFVDRSKKSIMNLSYSTYVRTYIITSEVLVLMSSIKYHGFFLAFIASKKIVPGYQ